MMLRLAASLLVFVLGASAQDLWRPIAAAHGMVASAEPIASQVGADVLFAGGNAIDAAVAVGFALAVTYPAAGNLGGGAFLVVHLPGRTDVTIDAREMAPARAHRDLYRRPDGSIDDDASKFGALASATPGSVAGLLEALDYGGTWPRERVIAPALCLAREGFVVSAALARALNGADFLDRHPESRRIFRNAGRPWRVGDRLIQPELAATLEAIAADGRDGFYRGPVAAALVGEMERGGGAITAEDLVGYRVRFRAPVRGTYRGHDIVSMPPPSSGGVALIEMLNLLEAYPLRQMGPGSERTLHALTECMRIAFRDRTRHLGDPDFSVVPVQRLLSKEYAALRRPEIGELATSMDASASIVAPDESEQTTHYSVVDGQGVAVAVTTTLNGSFGSGVTVSGAGFLLNNEMDDFAVAPGVANMFGLLQGEANAIGPRRRPLSSMTPTIVSKDGEVLLVVGSPGGPTIITAVLQTVLNVLDHEMDVATAVAAPRIHHQGWPDRIDHEKNGINPDVARGLSARGHVLERRSNLGNVQAIQRWKGRWLGASDPRGSGLAIGH